MNPIRTSVIAASVLLSTSQLPSQTLAARVDSVLRAAEAEGFSGVVRIEQKGALIVEKGYGLANRASNTPFTPATVVQIGSNTKDFTAIAILQLKDKERLSLTDSLGRFFPSAPADKRGITIRQLMSHEAGYPLGLGPDFDRVTREQFVDAALKFNLLFKPGERRSYSNTGYALLAAIIEKVSGTSYDKYVRDNILNPVGLRNTGFHLPNFPNARLAHGYRAGGEDAGTILSHPHLPDGPYWNLRGNGGMLSTVSDMHEFYRALFETDKLLRPETRNARFNPREPVAMAGSDLISFFLYERDPIIGVEMIVASNSQDYKVPRVMDELRKIPELGGGGGREVVTDGPGPGVARRSGNPPSPAIAAIANELIAAFNSGDTAVLRAFVAARFESGPDAPRVEERMERLGNLHAELGTLEVVSIVDVENGPVEVNLKSAKEGQAQMILDISRTPPHRIRRFGIQIGG